jgi:cell division transport system permease protein
LIGATSLFISIPYLIEGAILGAAGGGIALGFLRGGFELFTHKTQGMSVFGGFSSALEFFPLPLSLILMAGGILLGCLGTLTTIYGSLRFRL